MNDHMDDDAQKAAPAWATYTTRNVTDDARSWIRYETSVQITDDGRVSLSEDRWDDGDTEVGVYLDTPSEGVPIDHAAQYAATIALFDDVWRNDRKAAPTRAQIDALAAQVRELARLTLEGGATPIAQRVQPVETRTPEQCKRRAKVENINPAYTQQYRRAVLALLLEIAEGLEDA